MSQPFPSQVAEFMPENRPPWPTSDELLAAGVETSRNFTSLFAADSDAQFVKAMFFGPRGETFERIEKRYLVDDIDDVLKQLRAHGKTHDYGVTTMYLDHQTPTWALQGESRVKFRVRRYDTGETYFEQKVKYNGVTYKKRNKIDIADMKKDLVPVGIVSYKRTEFEKGKSRITIDRDVDLNGRLLRKFVVEVKGELPKWLNLPNGSDAPDFSKSRAMLRLCEVATIPDEEKAFDIFKVFCATGEGGGVDPTCSPSHSGATTHVTDTPEFKNWFGESKVVNADGKPLVVYHGTTGDFDNVFDTSKGELGIHFGTAAIASGFGERPTRFEGGQAIAEGGRVYPVYLSLQNPLRMKDEGSWSELGIANTLVEQGKMTEAERDEWKAGFDKRWKEHDWSKPYPRQQETQNLLEGKGFDGIVYINRREGIKLPKDLEENSSKLNQMTDNEFLKRVPNATTSWIAIRPTQIKSATGNRTFDPNDPDMTKLFSV